MIPAPAISAFGVVGLQFLRTDMPGFLVLLISIVLGLLMVVVFRYTSDQKEIRIAKDHIKAHLLAVRLFQDQLGVVLRSYGGIIIGTGRYLRLTFKPLLFVIPPLILLIAHLDFFFGLKPLTPGQPFLVKVRAATPEAIEGISLSLPEQLASTAPVVHALADREVIWRIVANAEGRYDVTVRAGDLSQSKQILVASGLRRVSPIRLQGQFWKRMLLSGEPALTAGIPVQSIEVQYPLREVFFAGFAWNWIWLFFLLSLVAGFLFKSVLGIEI